MTWAVLQNELEPLEVEGLARAFEATGVRTAADARQSAEHMRGIVVGGLTRDKATALAAAMSERGLGAVAVEESELVTLGPVKKTRRVAFEPGELVVFDSLDRPTPWGWERVLIVGAGQVVKRKVDRTTKFVYIKTGKGGYVTVEGEDKVKYVQTLMLEVLMDDGQTRLHFDARDMLFDCLGGTAGKDRMQNFVTVIETIASLSPHAIVNEVARHLMAHGRPPFTYPTAAAFEREITWLIWKGLR